MSSDIISEITLDVAGTSNRYTTVRAKQGDSYSRKIHAKITNAGMVYQVSAGSTVMINFRRYDDYTKSFEGEVEEDGTVTLPLPYWALELPYSVTCDVAIIETISVDGEDELRKLTTFNFYIDVEATSVSDNDVQADDETSYLLQLITTTQALADDFKGHYVKSATIAHPDITIANRTHYCYSKPEGISSCSVTIPADAEQGGVADIAIRTGSSGVPILFRNYSNVSLRIVQFSAEMASAASGGGTCTFGAGSNKIIHLFISVDGLVVQCVVEELEG